MANQSDSLNRLAPEGRVAVIRLRSLGDCVLCTPALRLVKAHRPDLQIGVVVEDRFAGIFDGNPDVAAVLPPAAGKIRAFQPQLVLNLHGGTRSARLTVLSGAAVRAGFDIFRPGWAYNVPIPTAQEVMGLERRVHTAEHMAAAVFYLGVPIVEIPRAFVPAPRGRSPLAPAGRYAVVHPFGATPEKTWASESFVQIAERLEIEPVIIGAESDEFAPFQKQRTVKGASLPEIAQLIRDAALFVGNDSGPAHMAAAFGVPSVVLFGASDAEIWSPWRTPSVVLKGAAGIDSISVDNVFRATGTLLASDQVGAA